MRRILTLATAIALLALGATQAWAFTPQINTYAERTADGHRVQFWIDTRTVHNFDFEGRTLFSNAQYEHHVADDGTAVWRFHIHSEHWRVHGHWVGHTTVHGSICNLVASATGCAEGAHLQTYVAEAKPTKGP